MDCRSGGLRFRETVTPAASAMLVRKHTNTHYIQLYTYIAYTGGTQRPPLSGTGEEVAAESL